MSVVKSTHARPSVVRRAITAFVEGGMELGSVKLYPDGTIEIFRKPQVLPSPTNDFDRLDRDGLL